MAQLWTPGTRYELGDVVEFESVTYKIIQPHTSQSDWTPPATPALWGRIPGSTYQQQVYRQEDAPANEEKPFIQPQTSADLPPEHREKHWYDLDDKQKKALEIGGGLAAGLALLGTGVAAYRHHEKKEEEKKALAWSAQKWIEDAQKRTHEFYQYGPRASTAWILVHGQQIPKGAIVAGRISGQVAYITRAFYEGGLQIGHASISCPKGARIGYGHHVVELDTYEILIGDSSAITWVDAQGRFRPENTDYNFVEGGRESNGTPLFIALVSYDDIEIAGKASRELDGALIAHDGTEKRSKEYKVLAYI